MDYILAAVFIITVMYAFDKAVLWLERNGWLKYQQTEKCNGKSIFGELSDYTQTKVCPADSSENSAPSKPDRPTRYFLE